MKLSKEAIATIFHLGEHLSLAVLVMLVVWWLIGSIPQGLASAFASLFIDLDHFIEYFLFTKNGFSLDGFLVGSQFQKRKKAWLVFHGWEYVFFLLFFLFLTKKTIFFALALGIAFHLLLDQFRFAAHWGSYFFFYRLKMGFCLEKLFNEESNCRK